MFPWAPRLFRIGVFVIVATVWLPASAICAALMVQAVAVKAGLACCSVVLVVERIRNEVWACVVESPCFHVFQAISGE